MKTSISREVKPGEVAIVTVEYIRAGTKNNIIPDEAELGLTVRTYKPEIRRQVLAAIARITKGEAEAAGALAEPKIEHYEATDAVYNDPALAERLRGALRSALGINRVLTVEPTFASEDYSYFVAHRHSVVLLHPGRSEPQEIRRGQGDWATSTSQSLAPFRP